MDSAEVFEAVGGEAYFVDLVDAFYVGVESDPLLRPMYPDDLTESKEHLVLFLVQYFGGPPRYLENRGHPRMRMRHAPYAITEEAANAWLAHMRSAMVSSGAPEEAVAEMDGYFSFAARALRNA